MYFRKNCLLAVGFLVAAIAHNAYCSEFAVSYDDEYGGGGASFELYDSGGGLIDSISTSGRSVQDLAYDPTTGGWLVMQRGPGNPAQGKGGIKRYSSTGVFLSSAVAVDVGTNADFAVVVPEPSTFILAALGLLSLGMIRRKRQRA